MRVRDPGGLICLRTRPNPIFDLSNARLGTFFGSTGTNPFKLYSGAEARSIRLLRGKAFLELAAFRASFEGCFFRAGVYIRAS